MDCSPPGFSVHGISRQEYWSGLPWPSLGNLSNPGIDLECLMSPTLAGRLFTTSTTWEAHDIILLHTFSVPTTTVKLKNQKPPSNYPVPLFTCHDTYCKPFERKGTPRAGAGLTHSRQSRNISWCELTLIIHRRGPGITYRNATLLCPTVGQWEHYPWHGWFWCAHSPLLSKKVSSYPGCYCS